MGGNRDPWVGRMLGRLSLRSAARPKQTVAVIALLTLVVGFGMTQLETDADMLKILPKDHPTTHAAQNASQEFHGFYDFVTIIYEVAPQKCEDVTAEKLQFRDPTNINCGNITDEAYVRGMDEVFRFFDERIPEVEYAIDLANIVKTVNWTNSGYAIQDDPSGALLDPLLEQDPSRYGQPRDEAFALPGTDPVGAVQYEAAWRGANAADDSVNDAVASTFKAGRTLLFFDADAAQADRVDLGRQVFAVIDEYQAAIEACDDDLAETPCELDWNVFSSEGLAQRGISTLDAHASDVTQRDISILAPIIIWAIVVILYAVFRDVRVILVAAANLLIAFVWTAGLMGWMRIPFSALNMTVVPLILGVGIDYGIHMVSEFLEHKRDRMSDQDAFKHAGRRAGIAMAIATVTTITGLVLMVFSPSVLMGQLGIVSSIALFVTFLFTMTLVPALLVLTAKDGVRRRVHQGSRWIPRLAATVARYRLVAILILLAGSAAAAASMQDLKAETFGNPELNYPHGDRVRDDAEFVFDVFYGGDSDAVANFLVLEGDMTRPETHAFIRALEQGLQDHPDIEGFSIASPVRIVEAWLAIDGGTPDAVVSQFLLSNFPTEGTPADSYPQDQQEIEETFDAIFAGPFANFMTVLLNEDYDMATVTYDTRQGLDFEEVERIWLATQEVVQDAREETGVTAAEVNVQPFGNNAFSYLFIEEEQPWVNTIGLVSFGTVLVLIGLLTRNVRATACTAVVMGVTSLWWLGTLPLIGVGLSVGLMLPLVFIMAIGSDDAIHLIWNMELTHDRNKVYRFVGQAVLLTTVTTFVAFLIFSRQTDLLVTRTLLATAVAVAVMWVATMLVVPVFYPNRFETEHSADAAEPQRPARPHAEPTAVTHSQSLIRDGGQE